MRVVHTLTLFTSMSTLICCALPALFVAIGAGAALAGVVANVPQLVWISEHKLYVFIFAGVMLSVSGILRYRQRNAPCPIDVNEREACMRLRKMGSVVYKVSVAIFLTGVFFAYGAKYIF